MPLSKQSECVNEFKIEDFKNDSDCYESKPKVSEMNTITRPCNIDHCMLNRSWLPVWKVIKALYVKPNREKLNDQDELDMESSLMLLIHAYRKNDICNTVKTQIAQQLEQGNEVNYFCSKKFFTTR